MKSSSQSSTYESTQPQGVKLKRVNGKWKMDPGVAYVSPAQEVIMETDEASFVAFFFARELFGTLHVVVTRDAPVHLKVQTEQKGVYPYVALVEPKGSREAAELAEGSALPVFRVDY